MEEMLREAMVLGLGNPLLDISSNVDEDFLDTYKMKPNDAILASERHETLYSDLVKSYKVDYTAGGATQNALRVAQWVLRKPNVCAFMGCVGQDKNSQILEEKARDDGVNVQYQYNDKELTGTCAVLITKNGTQRSLCANLAAANHFTIDHIHKAESKKLIQQAEYFYISGFFLTVSIETILEIAQTAHKRDKIFMMNLSAPFLVQFFKTQMMQAMPYVDILFGNETEAATFAKEHNFDTEDMHKIALKITQLPKQNPERSRMVIITQGTEPVIVAKDGETTEFPVEILPPEKIIDTNGAGDAFVGGFIAQLVKGNSLENCIKCGIWTATQIIQRSGCSFDNSVLYEG